LSHKISAKMNDLLIKILLFLSISNFCKSANITLDIKNLFQKGDDFLINCTYSLSKDEAFNYYSIFQEKYEFYTFNGKQSKQKKIF
jgi:hypothetical protein